MGAICWFVMRSHAAAQTFKETTRDCVCVPHISYWYALVDNTNVYTIILTVLQATGCWNTAGGVCIYQSDLPTPRNTRP